MTISSVVIRDQDGNTIFTFNPVPPTINMNSDNSPGKNKLDLPSYYRPTAFFFRSSETRLTIKATLLGTAYGTGKSILNWLDEIKEIMRGAAADYYQIQIPFVENFSGSPISYNSSDSAKENAMFASGQNYMMFFCHPEGWSIDRMTANSCDITLNFAEVDDVIPIG